MTTTNTKKIKQQKNIPTKNTPTKKESWHPHLVTIQFTNKTKIPVKSCYGKEGDTLVLDIDPYTHAAWSMDKHTQSSAKRGQIAVFNRKFQHFKDAISSPGNNANIENDTK